jgi:hypothetical protein
LTVDHAQQQLAHNTEALPDQHYSWIVTGTENDVFVIPSTVSSTEQAKQSLADVLGCGGRSVSRG